MTAWVKILLPSGISATQSDTLAKPKRSMASQRAPSRVSELALGGQGDPVEAAWAYLEATKADASDLGAFRLPERLLAEHPQPISECAWLAEALHVCHELVEDALDASR